MAGLVDLEFIDMMLGPDFCDLKGMPGADGRITSVAGQYQEDVSRLRELCRETAEKRDMAEFTITFDGCRLRVTGLVDDRESSIWLISRATAQVMQLDELNLPRQVVDAVMAKDLTGVTLVIGSFGVGKTTVGASIFAARVREHGGLGLTFEEPPELAMSGPCGKGRIVQVPINRRPGFYEEMVERGHRSRAENFYFGEIRNAQNAIEVQYLAVNDRPIISTIHGETMWQALMKFQALCRKKDSSPEALNSMLAESLSVLIHLSLDFVPTANGHKRLITPRCLVLGKDNDQARAKIRAGDFRGLADEIGSQGAMRSHRAGAGAEPASEPGIRQWRR